MNIRSVVLVVLCLLSAIFLIINWGTITAPVTVNFLFTQQEAPLGLILLLVLGLLWIVGMVWALMQQASVLLELRKANKNANVRKSLAEKAELSRVSQTKTALEEAMTHLEGKLGERFESTNETMTKSVADLRNSVVELNAIVHTLSQKVELIARHDGVDLPAELKSLEAQQKPRGLFGFLSSKPAEDKPVAKPELKLEQKSEEKAEEKPAQ